MKSRLQTLLDKSIAAMRAAVDIVNRPKYDYREEVFVILCVNAWELLIKAKWLKDHKGKITSLYVVDKQRTPKSNSAWKRYKKTRSNNAMTHELLYLVKQLNAKKTQIEPNVVKNIELMIETRDCAIHFFNQTAEIDKLIRGIGIASVKNYIELIKTWFNVEADEFGFCLVPISTISTPTSIKSLIGNKSEKRFIDYFTQVISEQDQTSSKSISLVIEFSATKSTSSPNAVGFQIVTDSDRKLTITEEDRLKQYPLDYVELVVKLVDRYSDFIRNKDFYALLRQVQADDKLCLIRYLDPKKKKTPKKFYSTNVFQFFDKHYTKK